MGKAGMWSVFSRLKRELATWTAVRGVKPGVLSWAGEWCQAMAETRGEGKAQRLKR